ncbi:hypothetical protein H2278_01730 [Campylobacter sp. W0018]|uniref:hypothetical protein n=1 Tax=Campylobacter sp. W0018 TaxID=2735782 RepID=UPI00301CEA8C|nr:hypothetical protein [Campylobacter sp. W0018]
MLEEKLSKQCTSLLVGSVGMTFIFLLLFEPLTSSYIAKTGILARIILGFISLFFTFGFTLSLMKSIYLSEDEKKKLKKIAIVVFIISFIICFILQLINYSIRDSRLSYFDAIMPFYYVGFGHYILFLIELFYLILFFSVYLLIFKSKYRYKAYKFNIPFVILFIAFSTYIFYLSFCFDFFALFFEPSDNYNYKIYLKNLEDHERYWNCWFGCKVSTLL